MVFFLVALVKDVLVVRLSLARGFCECFRDCPYSVGIIVQELCDSRGGRPGLSVLTSLLASLDIKLY